MPTSPTHGAAHDRFPRDVAPRRDQRLSRPRAYRVTVLGALDNQAIALIDDATESAGANDYTLTFELSQMSSITPDALSTLLARGLRPYNGLENLARRREST